MVMAGRGSLSHIYQCILSKSGPGWLSASVMRTGSSGPSRLLCQSAGDNNNDESTKANDVKKKGEKRIKRQPTTTDPVKAKARLNELLQSIVKEQDERSTRVDSEKTDIAAIDFKLAKPIQPKPPPPTEEELKVAAEEKETERELGKEMLTAVKTVASAVEGDSKEVESELVQKLKSHAPSKVNLNELFASMKIDKSSIKGAPPSDGRDPNLSRAHQVRQILERQNGDSSRRGRDQRGRDRADDSRPAYNVKQHRKPAETYTPINLFGARPLGIFSLETKGKSDTSYLKTWDALQAKDLKMAGMHPPANAFEEMIMWTEQGKLWKYPINNEQGLDEEAKVSFTEHVFLEPHMDNWCPKRGPIRHFMELVCVGLSKNPYLTVQEKKDQIEWYHEYFKGKASIIKEVGAGEIK